MTSKLVNFLESQSYGKEFKQLIIDLEKKYGREFFNISGIGDQLDTNQFAKNFFSNNKNTADISIDSNSNVSLKNIIVFDDELTKPLKLIYSYYRLWKGLKKKYGVEYANNAVEKQLSGEIYVNDFHGFATNKYYCYNYSTLDTAMNGIPKGIDAEVSLPTKYLNTYLEHLQLFCVHAGASSLGAVGLADLLLTVSAYADRILSTHSDQHTLFGNKVLSDLSSIIGNEWGNISDGKLQELKKFINSKTKEDISFASDEECWTFIKEKLTNFVYFLNQPNRLIQSLFSNVSIFDNNFLDSLIDHYCIIDGDNIYRAKKENVIKIQDIFLDIMNDTMSRRITTFPVLTACVSLDDNRNVLDEEFLKKMVKFNNKFCMINFYGGKTSTLSSCCFDKNQLVLAKSSNLGVIFDTFENIYNMKPCDDHKKNFTIYHNGSWTHGDLIRVPRGNKKLFNITTMNNKQIKVTEDHINVTLSGDKKTTELTTEDYIAFNTRKLDAFPENDQKLTYEQGFVVGLYLDNGSKRKSEDQGNYEITFSLNKNDGTDLGTLRKGLNDWKIEEEPQVHWQNNTMLIKLYSKDLFNILGYYVEKGHTFEKELNMNILLQSVDFRKGIVDGWCASNEDNNSCVYTTSEELVPQAEALFNSLGLNTSIGILNRVGESNIVIHGKEYDKNFLVYCIHWYNIENERSMGEIYKVVNNTEYFKIKSIKEVEYNDDYVYCFDMCNKDEPYFTLPNGIITHNCRLRSDKENKYFSTLSGAGTKIGSLGVCTLNLPRLAVLSNGDIDSFKNMIKTNVTLGQRINDIKRGILKKAINKKMIPVYNLGYVLLETQYSTVGINGLYEALEILGFNMADDKGIHFAEYLLDFINECNDAMGEELKAPVNLEQIPAENVSIKLAQKDRILGYNDKYEIYSNQFIPLTYTGMGSDVLTKIRIQGALDKKLSGGSILHININENNVSDETFLNLIKATFKSGTIYFAFNKLLCICAECGKIFTSNKADMDALSEKCPSCGSDKLEHAIRIVGFIRKFSSFSEGRRKEVKQRVFYDI